MTILVALILVPFVVPFSSNDMSRRPDTGGEEGGLPSEVS